MLVRGENGTKRVNSSSSSAAQGVRFAWSDNHCKQASSKGMHGEPSLSLQVRFVPLYHKTVYFGLALRWTFRSNG